MVNREWLCDNRERPARSLAPGVTQAECVSNSTTGGSTSLGLAIVGRSSPLPYAVVAVSGATRARRSITIPVATSHSCAITELSTP